MRQFDLFPNPSARSRSRIPFVTVIQSHLLASHTVVVAPVIRDDAGAPFTQTSVKVRMQAEALIVLIGELAAVEMRSLRGAIGNLGDHEDDLRRALDRLLTGF